MKNMNQKEIWNKLYSNGKEWKKETMNLPDFFRNKRVLEVGVGNGKTLISILKQKPKEVIAIDISEKAIEICKNNFEIKFICESIEQTSFKDKSFDIVVLYYVLNNVDRKTRMNILKEISRILREGGKIIFQDFSYKDYRKENKKNLPEKNSFVDNSGLICHFFDIEEIKVLFKEFRVLDIQEIISKPMKFDKKKRRAIINGVFEKI